MKCSSFMRRFILFFFDSVEHMLRRIIAVQANTSVYILGYIAYCTGRIGKLIIFLSFHTFFNASFTFWPLFMYFLQLFLHYFSLLTVVKFPCISAKHFLKYWVLLLPIEMNSLEIIKIMFSPRIVFKLLKLYYHAHLHKWTVETHWDRSTL